MLCPNCKNEIDNDSLFCERCGAKVKKTKKSLWISLTAVCVAVFAVLIVVMIQESEQQEQFLNADDNLSQYVPALASGTSDTVVNGYVDLGLPSGTLWKNANEGGDNARYTYDEALQKFGNKLPTNQQLVELKNECEWTWFGDGYMVTGPNGNSIYLPAAGYRYCDGVVYGVGTYGDYWSSTLCNTDLAWYLGFNSGKVSEEFEDLCYGQSVRLVQNP